MRPWSATAREPSPFAVMAEILHAHTGDCPAYDGHGMDPTLARAPQRGVAPILVLRPTGDEQ